MTSKGRGGRPYERLKAIVYSMGICWLCGKPVRYDVPSRHPLAPSLDHVIPVDDGGPSTLENARLAHYGCNSRRGKGHPDATAKPRPRTRDYGKPKP